MNQVNVIGRLTKEVEIRYLPTGTAIANGTLAKQVNDKIPGWL